jgi:hypothetical protein
MSDFPQSILQRIHEPNFARADIAKFASRVEANINTDRLTLRKPASAPRHEFGRHTLRPSRRQLGNDQT